MGLKLKGKKLKAEVVAVGSLVLVVAVFFYKTVLWGMLPIPSDALVGRYHPWTDALSEEYPRGVPYKNFLITDPVRQLIPWRKLVVDNYQAGELPGWDPYTFGGSPLDLNIQAAAFYPLNLLFLSLPFTKAWTALVISQVLGMVVFTYVYLRSEELSAEAAGVGAIISGFSGFVIAWLYWGTMVSVLMWLPLLLAIIRSYPKPVTKPFRPVLLLGFVLGSFCVLTAGHVQISLYVLLLVLIFGFKHIRDGVRSVGRLGVISASILIMVAGGYIYRYANFLSLTVRGSGATNWQEEGFFIPLKHLIQYVAPDYYGNPGTFNYWSTWNYGELVGYVGIVGLILAIGGGIGLWSKKQRFWPGVIIGCLLLALNTPLAWLPYWLQVPVWSTLQPTRLLALIGFGLAVLAAYGYEKLRKQPAENLWTVKASGVLAGVMMLAGLIALVQVEFQQHGRSMIAWRNLVLPMLMLVIFAGLNLARRWMKEKRLKGDAVLRYGVVMLLVVDLFRFGWKFLPFTPAEIFYPESKAITYLQNSPRPFRTMSMDIEVAPTNTLAWYGIEMVGGYNPVYTESYARFIEAMENDQLRQELKFQRLFDPRNYGSSLARYMNVRYVLAVEPVDDELTSLVLQEGETYVYEIPDELGRWYLADRIESYSDDIQGLEVMMMDEHEGKPAFVKGRVDAADWGKGTITMVSYGPNRQELAVAVNDTAYLVNGTAWHSKWSAYIDDDPAEIYQTNYLFMGVVVPAGQHQIVFVYE